MGTRHLTLDGEETVTSPTRPLKPSYFLSSHSSPLRYPTSLPPPRARIPGSTPAGGIAEAPLVFLGGEEVPCPVVGDLPIAHRYKQASSDSWAARGKRENFAFEKGTYDFEDVEKVGKRKPI